MTNDNCLQGIACPKCGNDSMIHIDVRTLARVTDDGAETFGDMEWDSGSYAECPECHFNGTLADFQAGNSYHDSTNHEKEKHP